MTPQHDVSEVFFLPDSPVAKAALELNATAASLLGFLSAGPQTGYELAAAIESSIGAFWNVTRSQIYRELRVLEAAGCISVGETGARDRRPYRLTSAGRDAFAAWIAREPGVENIRFPLLLTLFFGESLPKTALAKTLETHRARHRERLAGYRAKLPQLERERPYPALAARFGLMYEEAVLAWFASLEADGLMDADDGDRDGDGAA